MIKLMRRMKIREREKTKKNKFYKGKTQEEEL
jgi:hypothetical protein